MQAKVILSLFLLLSGTLILYYPIKTYSDLPDNSETHEAKIALSCQICGFLLLFFTLLLLIWYIPVPEQSNEFQEARTPESMNPSEPTKTQRKPWLTKGDKIMISIGLVIILVSLVIYALIRTYAR